MRFLAIALLSFCLAGCATFQADMAKLQQAFTFVTTASVTPEAAQIVVSSFEVLEAATTEYYKYCKSTPTDSRCAPGTVANPGPLRLVIKYDRQGRSARDQIKAAGKSGALISSTVYNLLVSAVSSLSASPASSFGAAQ